MTLSPFDLAAGPFLALYAALLVLAGGASLLIPARLRAEGRSGPVHDADALAWLAGGPGRVAESAAGGLLACGALSGAGRASFHVDRRGGGRNHAEAAALALPSPVRWKDLDEVLRGAAEPAERRLVAAGMAVDRAEAARLRWLATLPLLLLTAFGVIRWVVGVERDRPVEYLAIALLATAVLAGVRFRSVEPHTRAGGRALAEARARAARLRLAPTAPEVDLAVALFGTGVLVGSPWEALHQARSAEGDSGGGGCGSDGDGGGGCGDCGGD